MIDKAKVINFDFQGWPIERMNLRDIIKAIGGVYNSDTKKWEIPDNSLLDIFPKILEDDGMGYGVNEQWISDFSVDPSNNTCVLFREHEIEYPQIWLKYGITPYSYIKFDGKEWIPSSVDETDEGYMFTLLEFNPDKINSALEIRNILADELQKIIEK